MKCCMIEGSCGTQGWIALKHSVFVENPKVQRENSCALMKISQPFSHQAAARKTVKFYSKPVEFYRKTSENLIESQEL